MAIDPGLVLRAAAGTGLPPAVVREQINVESGGNPRAVSPAGAQGEFQFMPGTFASQHTGGSPFNPNDEVRAYDKLMSTLLRQYKGNVRNALAAYNAGPGNLGAGLEYADKILAAAGHATGLNAKPARGVTISVGTPGATFPSQIGGGVNIKAIGDAVLKRAVQRPIDTSGHVSAGPNLLGQVAEAERSGLFNATPQAVTNRLPGTPATGSLRTAGHVALAAHGDNVNPIETHDGWMYGRTDQGVDANAHPGAPIKAINNSRVVEIVPHWYAGQPLILLQLTSGPDAGKYWYVSEQIDSHVHVGQMVPRGAVVASYAPSGTGIEIGWGDPHSAGRTLAQAQGPLPAGHANTAAGQDFRNRILS